jgi:hypothetical protein
VDSVNYGGATVRSEDDAFGHDQVFDWGHSVPARQRLWLTLGAKFSNDVIVLGLWLYLHLKETPEDGILITLHSCTFHQDTNSARYPLASAQDLPKTRPLA